MPSTRLQGGYLLGALEIGGSGGKEGERRVHLAAVKVEHGCVAGARHRLERPRKLVPLLLLLIVFVRLVQDSRFRVGV